MNEYPITYIALFIMLIACIFVGMIQMSIMSYLTQLNDLEIILLGGMIIIVVSCILVVVFNYLYRDCEILEPIY